MTLNYRDKKTKYRDLQSTIHIKMDVGIPTLMYQIPK